MGYKLDEHLDQAFLIYSRLTKPSRLGFLGYQYDLGILSTGSKEDKLPYFEQFHLDGKQNQESIRDTGEVNEVTAECGGREYIFTVII